jgi:comEA protein
MPMPSGGSTRQSWLAITARLEVRRLWAQRRGAGQARKQISPLPAIRGSKLREGFSVGPIKFSRSEQAVLILLILVALAGLCTLVSRALSPRNSSNNGIVISEPPSSSTPGAAKSTSGFDPSDLLVVHIVGAVATPGVYKLPPRTRVYEAINAAGGAKPDATLEALNLAEMIQDGQQIFVPSKTPAPQGATLPALQFGQASSASAPGQKVNINTAGVEELDALPGVGPATAQKIIATRRQLGRFTSIEQLKEVPGIGDKKLENMRPYVRLY